VRGRLFHRAFTLIEILVAVALVGIVVSVVCGSMAATSRSVEAYRDRLSVTTRSLLGLQQISDSLRCCSGGFKATGDQLQWVSTRSLLDTSPSPGPFRVTLRWDSTGSRIVASETPQRRGRPVDEIAVPWEPLVDHVRAVRWSFSGGAGWQPDWGADENAALPLLVRIDMTSLDDHHRPYELQTLVRPACAMRPSIAVASPDRSAKP
jgi:prepilin-type N-terminal cleavage/methylation domain-containing protein